MNRSLVFDLATGAFIARHEDGLVFRSIWHRQKSSCPGHRTSPYPTGLSRLYRETHKLLDDSAKAPIDGNPQRIHGTVR
jgi:hypothetical protein